MLIIQNTEHFRIESPTIVTIGTFDGVHLGHQKILKRLQELKNETGLTTVVLTFEPHPRKALFPEQKDLKLITLVEEKLELLKKYGVDVTVVHPFDKTFAELEAEDYIKTILVKENNTKHLVIGYDHKFGKNRSGNIAVLKAFSKDFGFVVEEISAEDIDRIAISSTKIRKAIEEGNVELAAEFLGHHFFLSGIVIEGKQLGRTLGFATANLKIESQDKIIPKTGVYFVSVIVDGQQYFGMANIGINPTTDNEASLKIEVHIFEFAANIYSKTIKLNFLKRLRDEKKFGNLTELKIALHNDQKLCLDLISEKK